MEASTWEKATTSEPASWDLHHLCLIPDDSACSLFVFISDLSGWDSWSSWSHCSATCGNGRHYRSRKCLFPTLGCSGDASQRMSCDRGNCSRQGQELIDIRILFHSVLQTSFDTGIFKNPVICCVSPVVGKSTCSFQNCHNMHALHLLMY